MTETQLRYRSGLYLIGLHVAVFMLAVVFRFLGGYDTHEFTTIVGVVLPMFTGYTTAILAYIVKNRNVQQDTSLPVTGVFAFLVTILPTILVLVVCAAIWAQAFKRVFDNFEDFKTFLLSIESAFAIYVSMLVYGLFGRPENQPPATNLTSPPTAKTKTHKHP
jgi:hypothetical protein